MTDNPIKVAIVEDEFLIAQDLAYLCEKLGMTVVGQAANFDTAVKLIEETVPDYVLMDVRLQGKRDGVNVALKVFETMPGIKIIYVTGSNEPPTLARIDEDHPYAVLIKPVGERDLAKVFGFGN